MRPPAEFLAALALVMLSGCLETPCWETTRFCELGEECRTDDDCRNRTCIDNVCDSSCLGTYGCFGSQVCVFTPGSRINYCTRSCGPDSYVVDAQDTGYICEDSAIVLCEFAEEPERNCDVCGCPDGLDCWSTAWMMSLPPGERCLGACECVAP